MPVSTRRSQQATHRAWTQLVYIKGIACSIAKRSRVLKKWSVFLCSILKKVTFCQIGFLTCATVFHPLLFAAALHRDSDNINWMCEPWTHILEVCNSERVSPESCPVVEKRGWGESLHHTLARITTPINHTTANKPTNQSIDLPDESLDTSAETSFQNRHRQCWPVVSTWGRRGHDTADKRHSLYSFVADPTIPLVRRVDPDKTHVGIYQRMRFDISRTLHAFLDWSQYIWWLWWTERDVRSVRQKGATKTATWIKKLVSGILYSPREKLLGFLPCMN